MSRDDFSAKPTGARPLKVGEALRHALSEIFLRGETHVPALDNASITVSEVRISPDLRNATAYVMPLAGGQKDEVMKLLAEHSGRMRHLLSRKVELRYMPRIHYKLDVSFEEAQRLNEILHKPEVRRDIEEK